MKAILSIFICLAMLVSGLAFAEPAETPFSKLATIDNISVQVGTKSYDLPLAGHLGVSADSESALIDFGLDYNSDTLFPFQIKVTKDAISLLIGKSTTAYTFEAALLEGDDFSLSDISDMFAELMDAYRIAPADIEGADEAVAEAIDKAFNAPEEDATYEGQPAKRMTGTVESDQLLSLVDDILNVAAPNYGPMVCKYIQLLESMDDSMLYLDEEDSESEPEPEEEIDSIGALIKSEGIKISCDYDFITVESGAGKMDFIFHVKDTESGFEFSIPMTVTLDDAGNLTLESVFPITDEDDETVNCTLTATSNDEKLNLTFTAEDEADENNSISLTCDMTDLGDGVVKSDIAFNLSLMEDEELSTFSYAVTGTSDTNMNSDIEYAFSVQSGALDFGFKFHVQEQDGEIEDRIASANEKRFATDEDIENGASMLIMRLASLAGDVETLMNDSTISELADAFNEMRDSYYEDLYSSPSTYVPNTREDMPFEIPEFTYLPEGFELVSESYYSNADYLDSVDDEEFFAHASLQYALPDSDEARDDDEYYNYYASGILVTISTRDVLDAQYTLDADGKLAESELPTLESPSISVLDSGLQYTIEFVRENVDYHIDVYDNVLPIEDVPTFLAGIVWAE